MAQLGANGLVGVEEDFLEKVGHCGDTLCDLLCSGYAQSHSSFPVACRSKCSSVRSFSTPCLSVDCHVSCHGNGVKLWRWKAASITHFPL